jgi:hypothetical protein
MREFARAAAEFRGYGATFPEDRETAELAQLLEASVRGDGAARAAVEEIHRLGRGD